MGDSLKDWQLILEEEKVLCWSVSLQLGFFSQLHCWRLGDSFKPRENSHWPQWTAVLGLAPGLEGMEGECVWQPWLKARTLVWEAGQTGAMSSVSEPWHWVWTGSCSSAWRHGRGGDRGKAGGGKDMFVGRETPCVWIWFGFDLGTGLLWSVKVGAVIGQFKVPGEFKINTLIKDTVWFRQLTKKLAQYLFYTREVPFCHRSSQNGIWSSPAFPMLILLVSSTLHFHQYSLSLIYTHTYV